MSTIEHQLAHSEPVYAKSNRENTDYPWYRADIDYYLVPEHDKLWSIRRYPCTGLGLWLRSTISQHSSYPRVLSLLKSSNATFIDFGCYVGHDLRRLVVDGAPADRLYGVDIVNHWDVGFELFRDRDRFGAHYIQADFTASGDEMDPALRALRDERADVISLMYILHQWAWDDQVSVAKKFCAFSRGPGTLIVGILVGHAEAHHSDSKGTVAMQWRHNPESLERMFDLVGAQTGTKWITKARLVTLREMGWHEGDGKWLDEGDCSIEFVVERVL